MEQGGGQFCLQSTCCALPPHLQAELALGWAREEWSKEGPARKQDPEHLVLGKPLQEAEPPLGARRTLGICQNLP